MPAFGKIAEEEGFKKVAATFKYVTEVEKMHEQRYLKLLQISGGVLPTCT